MQTPVKQRQTKKLTYISDLPPSTSIYSGGDSPFPL